MEPLENLIELAKKLPSLSFGVTDVLDIAVVAIVIYYCIRIIRETRAFQLIKGLILLAAAYFVVYILDMQASTYIFRLIFQNIFIILVVVFQSEIRSIIEKLGRSNFHGIAGYFSSFGVESIESVNTGIINICKAVDSMSESKTGALIVMEKETPLGDIAASGTSLDAKISEELVGNIFYPKSPLHDGAAIVRGDRILAAGCVLPVTKNNDIPSSLGTRHRAAIGMSEACDAMIIVVSEETGTISVAQSGRLKSGFSESELREKLLDYYVPKESETKKGFRFFKKEKKK